MDNNSQPPAQTHRKKITKRTKLALLFILGPTVLFACCVILFAITNVAGGTIPNEVPTSCTELSINQGASAAKDECTDSLFGKTSATESVINTVIFTVSGIAILTWLPGLIAGIILLAKKPNTPETPVQ